MRIIVLFGALAISLPFLINFIPKINEEKLAARFFERPPSYEKSVLEDFARNHREEARRYATPVLVPLDMIYAIALGLFMALGSKWCADAIPLLKPWADFAIVVPCLFIACDLFEDASLARMFVWPDTITDTSVWITQLATSAKIKLVGLGLVQAGALAIWATCIRAEIG